MPDQPAGPGHQLQRDHKQHDAGAIVQQALPGDRRPQRRRHPHPPQQIVHHHRIGRRQDRPDHRAPAPRQVVMDQQADAVEPQAEQHGRHDHAGRRERQDGRLVVRAAPRGSPGTSPRTAAARAPSPGTVAAGPSRRSSCPARRTSAPPVSGSIASTAAAMASDPEQQADRRRQPDIEVVRRSRSPPPPPGPGSAGRRRHRRPTTQPRPVRPGLPPKRLQRLLAHRGQLGRVLTQAHQRAAAAGSHALAERS